MSESTKPSFSRRTLTKGAAWAVPAVAVAAPVAAAAVSGVCVPTFTLVPSGSSKCCDGPIKNFKITLTVTDTSNCIGGTTEVCITDVLLSNGGGVGQKIFSGCTTEGGDLSFYLLDADNCGVNLLVYYSVGGVPAAEPLEIQSTNIPSGNNSQGACAPPTTTTTTTTGTTTTTTTDGTTTTTTTAEATTTTTTTA